MQFVYQPAFTAVDDFKFKDHLIMKVRCIANTGEALKLYEVKELGEMELGRFGATSHTLFGGIEIGKEYLVMGIIQGGGTLSYLLDDNGDIGSYPTPLFEIVDNRVGPEWFFSMIKFDDERYPYQEALWGYHELVFDNNHYKKLISGSDEEAPRIYFRRKIEMEKINTH
jgi:hypothetical protein